MKTHALALALLAGAAATFPPTQLTGTDEPSLRTRRGSAATTTNTQPPSATPRGRRATGATNAATEAAAASTKPMTVGTAELVDFTDPTYGSKIRQLRKDDGHEHNFYYYREPWNADGTFLLGIQSDLLQKNWHVVLLDGDGHFLKDLFTTAQYDWRLCWDRKRPDTLYTWKNATLFRFNVKTGAAEKLKSFDPLALLPNGPSVSQDGDRVVVATSDKVFHSFRLSDLGDERTFKPLIPTNCFVSWDKPRYTGHGNTIDVAYKSADLKQTGILLYDDTGKLVHRFEGIGGGGHYAFSPEGRLAYFLMPNYPRNDGKNSLDIHVVNPDGTGDRLLFSAPRERVLGVLQNLHLSWPARVNDWFLASFYHFPGATQASYAPPFDEVMQVKLDGTTKYLARTGSEYSRGEGRGSSTDLFWAMPLCAPRADGKRISFNSNRSVTIDQFILYLEGGPGR